MNKSKKLKGGYRIVTITLTPKQERILDSIRDEIRAKQGFSLGRTEVIRAAIDYLATLDIDLHGIKNEEELLEAIRISVK